jgi:hypothetical protein
MPNNEIITKYPDRRSRYACRVVALRMQPTAGDNQRAINEPGDDYPTDGAGSHQQPAGLRNGAISHQ